MLKLDLLSLALNRNVERDLGEVEKGSLLLCQAKGGAVESCPRNQVSQLGGDSDKSYSKRGCDQLVDILPMGWW